MQTGKKWMAQQVLKHRNTTEQTLGMYKKIHRTWYPSSTECVKSKLEHSWEKNEKDTLKKKKILFYNKGEKKKSTLYINIERPAEFKSEIRSALSKMTRN